ncbi:MAG: hypothetical protein G01um10143_538 [Parcubacteria group bacterium Gr01-1014_3]|nr:MAG: hypothetical protein G01um10143_538 [Parcubacteria group bacterium Gr01-1014_3]
MRNLAVSKDYLIVSYVGVLFGLLILPILENTKPDFWAFTFINSAGIILGFLVFANLALTVGGWLGSRWANLWQFVKYAAAGSTNALLDIGILNFFSAIFRVYSGGLLVVFNIIALLAALINSFLLNKFWAFKNTHAFHWKEFIYFLGINLVTVIINSSMVYFLTTIIGAPETISPPVWENIAKLIAAPVTIMINFFGYKFIVFKV